MSSNIICGSNIYMDHSELTITMITAIDKPYAAEKKAVL